VTKAAGSSSGLDASGEDNQTFGPTGLSATMKSGADLEDLAIGKVVGRRLTRAFVRITDPKVHR
jgi:hypothetical protein